MILMPDLFSFAYVPNWYSQLDMLAERDHTTVEKVKEKISKRIWEGLHDPDPERRAQWERIPCAGDVPTPEEWLSYSVERLKEDGREDLLRHYLID